MGTSMLNATNACQSGDVRLSDALTASSKSNRHAESGDRSLSVRQASANFAAR